MKEITKDDVTVTIKADEEIQEISGFTKVDEKTYKKTYISNATEKVEVYDIAGNKSEANIDITNIDKTAPSVELEYSTKEITKDDVTVTIKADEEIQEISGFTKVDEKTYQKTYTSNATEKVEVYDIAGNKSETNIDITNIDKTAPSVELEYSTKEITKDDVTVTIKADEEIQQVEGFTKVDAKTYTKQYDKNIKISYDIMDLAGNKTAIEISITNIMDIPVVEETEEPETTEPETTEPETAEEPETTEEPEETEEPETAEIETPEKETEEPETTNKDVPGTGDNNEYMIFVVLLLLSSGVILVIMNKKVYDK